MLPFEFELGDRAAIVPLHFNVVELPVAQRYRRRGCSGGRAAIGCEGVDNRRGQALHIEAAAVICRQVECPAPAERHLDPAFPPHAEARRCQAGSRCSAGLVELQHLVNAFRDEGVEVRAVVVAAREPDALRQCRIVGRHHLVAVLPQRVERRPIDSRCRIFPYLHAAEGQHICRVRQQRAAGRDVAACIIDVSFLAIEYSRDADRRIVLGVSVRNSGFASARAFYAYPRRV